MTTAALKSHCKILKFMALLAEEPKYNLGWYTFCNATSVRKIWAYFHNKSLKVN